MEEPREHDGREQTEPMKEKAEGEAGETLAPSIPAASAPPRWWGIGGWALFVVALLFALFLAVELWRERQQMAALTEEANRLREAVASARRVFLERAVAELGYASVDLQADPPKRYQVTFRLDEASRWLRDALGKEQLRFMGKTFEAEQTQPFEPHDNPSVFVALLSGMGFRLYHSFQCVLHFG